MEYPKNTEEFLIEPTKTAPEENVEKTLEEKWGKEDIDELFKKDSEYYKGQD